MLRVCVLLMVWCFSGAAFAAFPVTGKPKPAYQNFDKQFVKLLKKWQIAGATVAVVKKHRLQYWRGFGWANKERKQPMRPETMMRVASVSKSITAIGVLKMVDEGRLRLSDRVFDILDLKPLPGQRLNSGVSKITIRDLLQMRAGWAKWFDPMFGPWPKSYIPALGQQPPADCLRVARYMMNRPLSYPAGTKYQYANINYCLLGLVISKLHNGTYGRAGYVDYMQKHVFDPIDIHGMYIANTNIKQQPSGEARYYPIKPPRRDTSKNPDILYLYDLPYANDQILQKNFANGGWVANSYQLVKLVNRLQLGQIIGQPLLKQMTYMPAGYKYKPGKQFSFLPYPYGLGWFLIHDSTPGRVWYGHGSFTGTNAMLIRRPNGTIYAVLFNQKPATYARVSALRHEVRKLLWRYA